MRLLEDGLVAAFAAYGMMSALYLLISLAVRPWWRGMADAVAVVPCAGEAPGLEQTVRALQRLRRETGCFSRVVLLDRGMSAETLETAALLCRDSAGVTLERAPCAWV